MGWLRHQADIDDRPWKRLHAAAAAMGPPWAVLSGVSIEAGPKRVIVDYVLVHPACGVVLIDAAEASVADRDRGAAAELFRQFLDDGEFETFFPGYLPIVQLPCELHAGEELPDLVAQAFADAPLLTVKDRGWANALVTVIEAARTDQRPGFGVPPAPAHRAASPSPASPLHPMASPPSASPPPASLAPAGLPPGTSPLQADPAARPVVERRSASRWAVMPLVAIGAMGAAALLWEHAGTRDAVEAPVAATADTSAPAHVVASGETAAIAIPPANPPPTPLVAPPLPSPAAPIAAPPPDAPAPPMSVAPAMIPPPKPPTEDRVARLAAAPKTPAPSPAPVADDHAANVAWPPLPAIKPVVHRGEIAQSSRAVPAGQTPHEPSFIAHPSPPHRVERARAMTHEKLMPVGKGPPIDAADLPPLGP